AADPTVPHFDRQEAAARAKKLTDDLARAVNSPKDPRGKRRSKEQVTLDTINEERELRAILEKPHQTIRGRRKQNGPDIWKKRRDGAFANRCFLELRSRAG